MHFISRKTERKREGKSAEHGGSDCNFLDEFTAGGRHLSHGERGRVILAMGPARRHKLFEVLLRKARVAGERSRGRTRQVSFLYSRQRKNESRPAAWFAGGGKITAHSARQIAAD